MRTRAFELTAKAGGQAVAACPLRGKKMNRHNRNVTIDLPEGTTSAGRKLS
jgi:hypothetical protein